MNNFHGLPTGVTFRNEMGIGRVTEVTIPDEVAAERLRRGAMNRSTITAAICGDPLPGESAFERGPEVIVGPYDPMRNFVPYQDNFSPDELRKHQAQIKLSPRNKYRRRTTASAEQAP